MKLLALFFSILLSMSSFASHHGDKECDGKKNKEHQHENSEINND
jgi:hypothetical protein